MTKTKIRCRQRWVLSSPYRSYASIRFGSGLSLIVSPGKRQHAIRLYSFVCSEWLISASSPPVDDVEQEWVDGFIDHLEKTIKGEGYSQARSPKEMMGKIISYCIGSYDRMRTYEDLKNGDWKRGLSIRQLFSDYINLTVWHLAHDITRLLLT